MPCVPPSFQQATQSQSSVRLTPPRGSTDSRQVENGFESELKQETQLASLTELTRADGHSAANAHDSAKGGGHAAGEQLAHHSAVAEAAREETEQITSAS